VTSSHEGVEPVRRTVSESETLRANRRDWDAYADEYQATHGEFLGDAGFIWSPEGVDEAEVHVLGEVAGRDVLEIGCGAAQCARWLTTRGARAVGLDVSHRQLQHGRRIDLDTGVVVPAVCGTATALPFPDGCFDVAFSAFGALQFVYDAATAVAEVARVLRPGGRFAFSVTHPIRWSMPDDPSAEGLVVTSSYWDRTPYVEQDGSGEVTYAEHHRTVGDWVRILASSGFVLEDLLEPEWPEGHDRVWGGWGPVRGSLIPGTAIFVARLG
jgi:SAM-dependent methyltransferase